MVTLSFSAGFKREKKVVTKKGPRKKSSRSVSLSLLLVFSKSVRKAFQRFCAREQEGEHPWLKEP